ncbi:MAG: hypothetical protein PHQ58_04665 [Rhodoferax sp.]|uniref:hypothetical protein n=1 Tax=Rhodoferax sp. TaxID=50421 RepID=UPI0026313684|nr:hypothetical protein [Rhodoferax sp.]MDD2879705.1 hypothetical protein [Rhodoferax sp.]
MSSIVISIFSLCFLGMLSLLLASSIPANFYKRAKEYFGSPLDGSFEFDWTLKQFYKLFSDNVSERWYESRAHCNRGVVISTLCAWGLIHVVRITYLEECGQHIWYHNRYHIYRAFRSEAELRALIKKQIDSFPCEESGTVLYFEYLFIAGQNVVHNP